MDEHTGALQYDFRERFHLPLSCIPEEMDWAEAWNLYEILSNDPSSQTCAAQAGWDYPMGRHEAASINTFDLIHGALNNKARPYPRPYPDTSKNENANYGKKNGNTVNADARGILKRRREGTNSEKK